MKETLAKPGFSDPSLFLFARCHRAPAGTAGEG
jgi:hypothetical protein